ncbi:hypothetical protein G9A89_005736 [Geosiphon pyriformis]|nr:hypothetical protein G9A89_005736 [Geosiphon pyriformis]
MDSVSGISDLDNVENVVTEETCYAELDVSGLNDDMNNAMPRKTRTRTYVLDSKLPPLSFNVPSDGEDTLPLPSPKFYGSNCLPSVRSCAPEKWNFNSSKSFALDIELSAIPGKTINDKLIGLKKIFYRVDGKVNSEMDSVSGISDLDNVENVVTEETCYAELDVSGLNDDMNNAMPRKTRTRTYVLDSKLPPLSFNVPSDGEDTLPLPSPKFYGSNCLPSVRSCAPEKWNFNSSKSFALDIELSAIPGKTINDKLIGLKKIFYRVDGFGRASTPSKFLRIIRFLFTSEISLNKARELAIGEKILVNNDLRKSSVHSDQGVIVKEIPVNLPKLAIEAVFSKFGKIISIKMQLIGLWQKALVEYKSSKIADLVAVRWFVFMGKDSVHVAKTSVDKQTDQHQALLYTLPVGTTAHDLSALVEAYGGKTCFIGRNPSSYIYDQCAVICFENETSKLAAIGLVLVFKVVSLHWAGLSLACCVVYKQFSHVSDVCSMGGNSGACSKQVVTSQDQVHLANVYKRKQTLITHPIFFGDKTWAQIASGTSSCVVSSGLFSVGASFSAGSALVKSSPSDISGLCSQLAILEHSLELLADRVSAIAKKLSCVEMISLESSSLAFHPIASASLASYVDLDMALNVLLVASPSLCPTVDDANPDFGSSSSKVLTAKVGGLESKLMALDASVGSVLARLDMLCSDSSLARHVCRVSEVPGQLLSVRLLFKNKLSVSILGLYAGAFSVVRFSQTDEINSLIAKAVNESSFIILRGDFNEDGSHKSANFKRCFDLGLVNSLVGSPAAKTSTWKNSRGVTKVIDYVFVFSCLVNAIVHHKVLNVSEHFDTDHRAVSVDLDLDGLLNTHLISLRKQANRDCWKFDVKDANDARWLEFKDASAANVSMFSDAFEVAVRFSDVDTMWDIVHKIMVLSASGTFKKKWFKGFDSVFTRTSSRFHKLELLVSKLCAEKSSIKQTIGKRMESFELNKGYTIRSVLEHLFRKVVLDYLVVEEELILEPDLVKSKVDKIMEGWTKKREVVSDFSEDWVCQFWPLDYVFNGAFSDVMCSISFDELLTVVKDLSDGKVAGLSGISNELWKHCDKSILDMLLVLLNFCLVGKLVPGPWREACVSMIPKPYECTFDVLHGDNFSVLKGTMMQSLIFAVGSVVEDALEKNCELWLVLQDMHKAYDSVKRQESMWGYRLNSHYVSKTDQVDSRAGLTSFLVAGAFVDNTIWVGSSQAATQHILDIASEFFRFNDISVNNDKTVAIPINCRVLDPCLTISGAPISIVRKGESHHYLGIFLSSGGLSKPSLAKAQADIWFFVNLVLKKAISDKQCAYLVSADMLVHKIFKSKSGLSRDFPSDALHHPSLYNLKTFEQIQAESKLASIIAFANSTGVLDRLFSHRSHDFQILSWHHCHPLMFLARVGVSLLNNFLAGVCVSSLKRYGIAFMEQLCDHNGNVFSWKTFKHWKRLDPRGPVSFWFDLSVRFLGGVVSLSSSFSLADDHAVSDIRLSHDFGMVYDALLTIGAACLSVYMDGSLSGLGSVNMRAGAAVFFKDINLGLGVRVSDLVSSTLTELQAIALALECVPFSRLVDLFSDSQAALDMCRSELSLAHLDFRNRCWIECRHITTVKGHLGVSGNDHVDALAKDAVLSAWRLPHLVSERFLCAGGMAVSGNSRHFVRDVFQSVHRAHWKVRVGSRVVDDRLRADINWLSLLWCNTPILTWHPALYHRLPVAVHKHLYDRRYPSVVCLFCGDVETSDHVFSCSQNAIGRACLLGTHASAWKALASCVSEIGIGVALCKGFVFDEWFRESVSVFNNSDEGTKRIVSFVRGFCLAFQDDI